jgi:hypothetical protein
MTPWLPLPACSRVARSRDGNRDLIPDSSRGISLLRNGEGEKTSPVWI